MGHGSLITNHEFFSTSNHSYKLENKNQKSVVAGGRSVRKQEFGRVKKQGLLLFRNPISYSRAMVAALPRHVPSTSLDKEAEARRVTIIKTVVLAVLCLQNSG